MTIRIKLLTLSLLGFLLSGCGSGLSGGAASNAVAASKGCVTTACHGTIASQVTGQAIGAEWRASAHYAANVAGCTTCHGHWHSNSCGECHGGTSVQQPQQGMLNASEKCIECHVTGPNLVKSLDGKHIPELNPNFAQGATYNATTKRWTISNAADVTSAGWQVLRGTPYASQCIWCHNPHDDRVLPQHAQWAESGHGATDAAYLGTDFKVRGTVGNYQTEVVSDNCVRCHTATGFVNWIGTAGSYMTNVTPWGLNTTFRSSTTAKTKQTLYCNVCHDNGKGKAYGFGRNNLRTIPALGAGGGVRIWYNYSTAKPTDVTGANANGAVPFVSMKVQNFSADYPNIGVSDRCLVCHAGRATGNLIKTLSTRVNAAGETVTFKRLARIGTHDFAGGGTMFKELGFEYYSSFRYAQPSGRPYAHDQLGMGTGAGPCVACHMSSAKSHSYQATSFSNRTTAALSSLANPFPVSSINTSLCSTCHLSGGIGNPFFNGSVTALNTKKTGYGLSVKAVNAWLVAKALVWARTSSGITSATNTSNWVSQPVAALGTNYSAFAPANPSANQLVCAPSGSTAADFIYLGTRNMGAALNYDFTTNEPGAYVHNDLYIKRIIYDTIDWLDDCTMNNSTPTALDFTNNTLATNTMMTLPTLTPPRQTDFRLSPADIATIKSYLLDPVTGLRPGGI